jgi:hypothetical protein
MSTYIDKKFIDLVAVQLRNFKWKKSTLANCSCPVCGDSSKNKRKARGFFFQKKGDFFYMCHNCGFSATLYNFLSQVSPAYAKEYSLERWKNGEQGHSNYKKPEITIPAPVFKKDTGELQSLLELSENHPAIKFCEKRKIPRDKWNRLFYTDNFSKFAIGLDDSLELKKQEGRLVIPFFDSAGNIIAAQGRLLEIKSSNDVRYMTIKADKSIDRLWYGIGECDPSKRVYIVEGPIDSLFLPNAVAMVGASNFSIHPKIAQSDVVVALDNEPRNYEIVSLMERFIDNGYPICVWEDGIEGKDINDMVLSGRTTEEIVSIIDRCTSKGMEARLKINFWKKV